MNNKIIISILILIILFSGCIDNNKESLQNIDNIQPQTTIQNKQSIEIFDISQKKIDDNNIQINIANIGNDPVSFVILKIQNTNTFFVKGDNESILGNLNPLDYTSASFNIKKIQNTNNEMSLRIEYTDINGKRNQTEKIIYIIDRYEIKESNNISFSWSFGCIKYCGDEGRPGESDGRFDIINTGNVDIPKMKLVIDFYASSGRFYNTKSSITAGFFDRSMNFIETIPVNSQGYIFIKIPSQYWGSETWSYAELYMLKDNSRYHLLTWKEDKNNNMPSVDGNIQIEQ